MQMLIAIVLALPVKFSTLKAVRFSWLQTFVNQYGSKYYETIHDAKIRF